MNLIVNYLPENWNPDCTKSINRWFRRIEKHEKKKLGIPLRKIN